MTPVIANFLSGIGMGELVVILLIVLIIFGAGKLPQIGDSLGKGIKNFKSAVSTKDDAKPSGATQEELRREALRRNLGQDGGAPAPSPKADGDDKDA